MPSDILLAVELGPRYAWVSCQSLLMLVKFPVKLNKWPASNTLNLNSSCERRLFLLFDCIAFLATITFLMAYEIFKTFEQLMMSRLMLFKLLADSVD